MIAVTFQEGGKFMLIDDPYWSEERALARCMNKDNWCGVSRPNHGGKARTVLRNYNDRSKDMIVHSIAFEKRLAIWDSYFRSDRCYRNGLDWSKIVADLFKYLREGG